MQTQIIKFFGLIYLLFWLASCTTIKPSQIDADAINFSTIKTYAELSDIAYATQNDIKRVSTAHGYTLTHYGTSPQTNIAHFLITNDSTKTQIIGVRGTANIENAIVDASVKFIDDEITGIRLHRGFGLTAKAIYQQIKPYLKPDYTINTTGHSLGGAVASILAMYLHTDQFTIDNVITFGQPKVTNIEGANKFSQLPILRVVTPKDIVPLVPAFNPADIHNLEIYWHPGVEVVLNTDNTYSTLSGFKSMLRAVNFTQTRPNEENLNNHKMTYYRELIENKLHESHEVPFKRDN